MGSQHCCRASLAQVAASSPLSEKRSKLAGCPVREAAIVPTRPSVRRLLPSARLPAPVCCAGDGLGHRTGSRNTATTGRDRSGVTATKCPLGRTGYQTGAASSSTAGVRPRARRLAGGSHGTRGAAGGSPGCLPIGISRQHVSWKRYVSWTAGSGLRHEVVSR